MKDAYYTVTVRRIGRRELNREQRKQKVLLLLREACRIGAVAAFLFALGSCGAVERETISLMRGIWQITAGLGLMTGFAWLSGGLK